jgi:hypothetical protein
LLTIALLAAPFFVRASRAEEPAPSDTQTKAEEANPNAIAFSYDATVASTYIFQGFDYSYGRSVLQPNASATWRGLGAGLWGNVQARSLATNEIDLSLKYARAAGKASGDVGYLNLRYPNRDWDPSQELFVDLAYASQLNPSLSVHYDIQSGDGSYTTLGLKRDLPSHLSFAANLFYQSHYYGMTGFPAAEFKISGTFPFGITTLTHSTSYFKTWENGDFRGDAAVPPKWLVAINLAR